MPLAARPRQLAVAALLFHSGLSALVYQVAWQREFTLIFGASTAASAAVLASFVAGLGTGSLRLGPRADATARPLRLYAHLEAGVATAAALSPLLLDAVRAVYFAAGGTPTLGLAGGTLLRLLLASLVVGLPTFLMGGTLPAAARAVEGEEDERRARVALLYGVNTLGAVAGAFLATFFGFERLGTRLTLWLACLLNLAIAGVARTLPDAAPAPEPREASADGGRGGAAPAAPTSFVLVAAGLVGAVYFLMEIVWYRMLAPLLGGTVFSFGLILAVALLGIGIGGALYATLGERRPASLVAFATTCLLEAALLALPLALGDRLAVLAALLQPLAAVDFAGSLLYWLLLAAPVVGPPSIVAGFQFPLLVALLGRGRERVGRDVGRAYAANTLGAVLGSLAGGFGLLPLLSAPGAWRFCVLALVGLALAAGWLARRGVPRRRLAVAGLLGVAALVLAAAAGPSAAWRHGGIGAGRAQTAGLGSPNQVEEWLRSERRALVWQAEGSESSVALVSRQGLAFAINGKIDGHTTVDAATQVMAGLLAAALQPQPPERALVIGLGTGSTAGWLASVPGVVRVDVVELEPAILDVARACRDVNRDVMNAAAVSVTIGDAREVLLASRERYDLVFSEPSNPYRAGIASLFTAEYYDAVARSLGAHGVFVQWLQAYEVDSQTVRSVYATLATRFAHVETWYTNRDLLLVARAAPPAPYEAASLRARIAGEPWRSALRDSWRVADLEGFLARYVAGPAVARALARHGHELVNHDDRNLIEFGFARSVGRSGRFDVGELLALARQLGAARPELSGPVDWDAVGEEQAALLGGSDGELTAAARHRLRATRLAYDDPAAALAAWGAQPGSPRHLRELLALAAATAEAGDDASLEPLLAVLEPLRAVEAGALRGIAAFRAGRTEAALGWLVSAFELARRDAWAFPAILQRGLFAATELARREPASADTLLQALSEPFAADTLGDDRRMALLTISSRLPADGRCVSALALVEPHVPWRADLLAFRLRCYEAMAPGLAPAARRDLARFSSTEPRPLVTGVGSR